jgi:diadenosine tetraphosphate (Ap4A) HIT family hydrolase
MNSNNPDRWNSPFFSTDNFNVVPSIGSLVNGWLLVFPKVHFLSYGFAPKSLQSEFRNLRIQLRNFLEQRYQLSVIEFEHGPVEPNTNVGCSVDHAHWHLVPFGSDVLPLARSLEPSINWTMVQGFEFPAPESGPYISYVNQQGELFVGRSRVIPSQLIRKAVAISLGTPEQWNWRDQPQLEIVDQTIRDLGGAIDLDHLQFDASNVR